MTALVAELGLDRTGRLLDVGCGPGSLTVPLAPWFARAVGLDADAGMLAEAARRADEAGAATVEWWHRRAEDLTVGDGPFRVVVLAQSLHWMDRETVLAAVRALLEPDGAVVHVHARTHRGIPGEDDLGLPPPPWPQLAELHRRHVPERPDTAQRLAEPVPIGPAGTAPGSAAPEAPAFRRWFTTCTRLVVPGDVVERTREEVVDAVLSISGSSPEVLGDRLPGYVADLRALLDRASPAGLFRERSSPVVADVWRP